MRALMELVEGDRHIVPTADLERKVAPDVLAAARRAGILRPDDPGFEDLSPTDLSRVLRAVYGLAGRQRPVPAAFEDAASPLGWMGSGEDEREVLLCPRPASGLAAALARERPTVVLVPTARHLTPALRRRHGPGAVVALEALEESLVALGGRLVLRAGIAPDAPGARAPRALAQRVQVDRSTQLAGHATRWTDLRICRIDSTTVRVDFPGRSVRCTHVDLGMARDSTCAPTQTWDVLWEICEHGGYFQTSRFGNENATRQIIHRFGRHMQRLFGIEGSPFHRYRKAGGWRARFEARRDLPEDPDGAVGDNCRVQSTGSAVAPSLLSHIRVRV